MRLVTYRGSDGSPLVGVCDDDGAVRPSGFRGRMRDLVEAGDDALQAVRRHARTERPVANVALLAPLVPTSLRDFLAFEGHLTTIMERLGREVAPEWYEVPGYYKSLPSTVIGPDTEIPWPSFTGKLDYELELAAVVGTAGRDLSASSALDHVFGWTIWNDVSARDVQARELPLNMGPGKAKDWDGSNVLGPCLVTADEVDGQDLAMEVRVNRERVGRARSSEMHHSFGDLLAYASMDMTLLPGEVLGSGTAPGGSGMEADRWLSPGDTIEMEIEGIGVLRNTVGSPTAKRANA